MRCPLSMHDIINKVIKFAEELNGRPLYMYQRTFAYRIIESVLLNDGATLTALWARQCLHKDTVILDRDGTACRIKDHPRAWFTGHKKVFTVKAQNGFSVAATAEHPFLTQRGWVPLGELEGGDQICVLDSWDKFGDGVVSLTSSIFINKFRTDTIEETFTITEDHGKLLGYLTTDGNVFRAIETSQSLKFTNTNELYLTEVEELVSRLFPDIVTKRYPKGNGYDVLLVSKDGRSSKTNSLKRFLIAMRPDCGFPTSIFSAPKAAIIAFLNRAFASDGCASRGIQLSGKLSSVYARYYQTLLARLGVDARLKAPEWMTYSTSPHYRLTIDDKPNMCAFLSTVGAIYGKEDACAALDTTLLRWSWRTYKKASDGEDGEHRLWSKIVSIVEEPFEVDVYDIEYPGKGWFFAHGIAVHNCGKTETISVICAALAVLLPTLCEAFPDDPRFMRFARGFHVGIYAPVKDQSQISFDRIRKIFTSEIGRSVLDDPDVDVRLLVSRGDTVGLSNGSIILSRTASENSQIEGKTHHLVICVDGSSKVTTPDGDFEIKELVESGYDGPVLGFYHLRNEVVWAWVLGRQKVPTGLLGECYRLEFNDGSSVVATGDHLWWIEDAKKYVPTRLLAELGCPRAANMFVGVPKGAGTGDRLPATEARWLISIKRVDAPEFVYDLTTATGNFFVNGVLGHNCEESQKISRQKVDKEIRPMLSSCVTGDTVLHMQDGSLLTMDEVQRQKRSDVWSVTSDARVVKGKVISFIDSGVQPTLRATLKSGRCVKGTRKHPVLVYDRKTRAIEWRRLRDLKVGDHVCLAKEIPVFGEFSVGGIDEAYFFGAMIGDGSYRKDGLPRLSNCDQEVWHVVDQVAEAHRLQVRTFVDRETLDGRRYLEVTFSGEVRGDNWCIAKLREAGIYGQVKRQKRFGKFALLNREELRAFISGLIDSDGWVTTNGGRTGTVQITQISRGCLMDLLHALQRFGIHGTIRRCMSEERVLRGRVLKASKAWKLTISGKENLERFAGIAHLRIGYKATALRTAIGYLSSRKSKRSKKYPDLVWEKVLSITDSGDRQVWDVVVPKHHSFIGNGIVLHNTNGTCVHIGTAWVSRGGFHHSIQLNEEMRAKGGVRNHFEIPYDIVVAEKSDAYNRTKNPEHLAYVKFIQGEIARVGVDSDEFKMNFRCLWQEARVIAIRSEVLKAGALPGFTATPMRSAVQVAGLDIGKVTDFTVLTIMDVDMTRPIKNVFLEGVDEDQVSYPKTILDWFELGGSFEGDSGQYLRLKNILQSFNVSILVVDATGIGDPVAEHITNMCKDVITVVPFKFSAATKSNLYKYYLGEWNSGRITYPASKETRDRLEYRKFIQEHSDLDKIQVGEYSVCKAPEGLHDDYPSSGALAAWAEKLLGSAILPDIQVTEMWGTGGASEEVSQSGRQGRYHKRWMR